MEDVGTFHGHFVNLTAILYISPSFGIFLPVLVRCTQKNLANLVAPREVWRKKKKDLTEFIDAE
jgi:hypothetical protein